MIVELYYLALTNKEIFNPYYLIVWLVADFYDPCKIWLVVTYNQRLELGLVVA
jgi:hypothetical protein